MTEAQESDLWWGSYSGWTMWPSFLVCLLLTGLLGWLDWRFVQRELSQTAFLGLSTLLWLVQFTRFSARVFGYNYRLTTHRLFRDRGYSLKSRFNVNLKEIKQVHVRQSSLEKVVNVGRVVIHHAGSRGSPIVLEGIAQPVAVAQMIHEAVQKLEGSR